MARTGGGERHREPGTKQERTRGGRSGGGGGGGGGRDRQEIQEELWCGRLGSTRDGGGGREGPGHAQNAGARVMNQA